MDIRNEAVESPERWKRDFQTIQQHLARQERKQERLRNLKTGGPCLICGQQMEYRHHGRYGFYARHGNKWLDRQFTPSTRARHLEVFKRGDLLERTTDHALFEGFVCLGCRRKTVSGWSKEQ
jgi:hypothetical protein